MFAAQGHIPNARIKSELELFGDVNNGGNDGGDGNGGINGGDGGTAPCNCPAGPAGPAGPPGPAAASSGEGVYNDYYLCCKNKTACCHNLFIVLV